MKTSKNAIYVFGLLFLLYMFEAVKTYGVYKQNKLYTITQLSGFTTDRAKWVIQWRFALFEPIRAPTISA